MGKTRVSDALVFALFGGGSGWFGSSLGVLSLPWYQEHYGLALASRFEMGYNLGTIPCVWWVMLGRKTSPRAIAALLVVQTACVVLLWLAAPGSALAHEWTIVAAMALGGTTGYMSQFVCVSYLMRFENSLVSWFRFGDSASAAISGVVALWWRRKGYGLRAYLVACGVPTMAASFGALAVIESLGVGKLSTVSASFARVPQQDETTRLEMMTTLRLAVVVFWSQFADWGIGDSIYPYACANAGDLERCELWCNESMLATTMLGAWIAAVSSFDPARLAFKLWLPFLSYTVLFFVLVVAALAPGLPFVVAVVALMRCAGTYSRAVVPRLIQPVYPPHLHETLAVFFGLVDMASNVAGSLAALLLIRAGVFGGGR